MQWLYTAAVAYAGSLLFFILKRERTAIFLLVAGFLFHTAGLITRGWYHGAFTPLNMLTELYFLPWCLIALISCLLVCASDGKPAVDLLPPAVILLVAALFLPVTTIPPSPYSSTNFATLFFLLEVLAHALFISGGWLAALYLLKRTGMTAFNVYAVWGFIFYSIAQVVGGIWSYLGWTAPFQWSERHLVSASIWCFYCAYLHLHFSSRWSPKGKAWFVLCGAVIMFIYTYAYYLVNLGVKHA
jgi:ABC-type transport system involved in cytochrome c biogenesis permease subunit